MDDDLPQTPGRAPPPARLPITNLSQWIERFSTTAAVLTTRFPEKALELFAYQASIVKVERNYEDRQWVAYDCQYRRAALARKDLNWSVPDARLYNEAFTGQARSISRCTYCLEEDHTAGACPRNPNRPQDPWTLDLAPQPCPFFHHYPQQPSGEICRRFNESRCKKLAC